MNTKEYIKDTLINWSKGRQLQADLGLEKFKYAYIQKIIDLAQNIYIVTVDSRYPNVFFGFNKLKHINTFTINKVRKIPFGYNFKNFKLTPPILLDDFKGEIPSNSIIIRQDIVGEYFQRDKMFECVNGNKKLRVI